MRKIGFIINVSINDTGVSTYVKTLLSSFEKDENFFCLITNDSWNDFLYQNHFKREFFFRKYLSFFYKTLVFFKFKRFGSWFFNNFDSLGIRLKESDINYLIFPTPCYLTFFIDKPAYVSIHDLMHITERKFDESSNFLRTIFRDNIYQNIGSNFNSIIFESNIGQSMFFDHYFVSDKCKTYILPYSCPNYVLDILESKSYINYDVNRFGSYFFYPASFWKHKNHAKLLYAFNNIIKKGYDVNLVFSGGLNKEYNHLSDLVEKLEIKNRIFFTGYVNDKEIVALYLGALALIMPSFFGPTNIPPIEAIYCNVPILVSDVYGMKDQLEDSALYFDPNSILSIEDSFLEFLGYTRNELVQRGQALKFKFNPEVFKANFNSILNES
jgi:glycosyltransferase involved in cell wall biosynthesis